MSIRTWKKEFYPVDSRLVDTTDLRAMLQHTLLKWTGALPRNRKKHNLTLEKWALVGAKLEKFHFDGITCVHCGNYSGCHGCPLDGVGDEPDCGAGAFEIFIKRGIVVPMLKQIRAALKELDATEKAAKRRGKR